MRSTEISSSQASDTQLTILWYLDVMNVKNKNSTRSQFLAPVAIRLDTVPWVGWFVFPVQVLVTPKHILAVLPPHGVFQGLV